MRISDWSSDVCSSDREAALRDERSKLFRQIRTVEPATVVRGQYRGYTDEEGVAPGSDVETYVALRMEIDSWRWAGVPFLIRTGKHLPVTATEAIVEFNAPPRLRSEEHTSELQSLMRTSYAVFCLTQKN